MHGPLNVKFETNSFHIKQPARCIKYPTFILS